MNIQVELTNSGGVAGLSVVANSFPVPGPGEICLRHEAVGVNFIDIYQRIGLYPLPLPAVLGVEGAGIVEAIGEGVDTVHVGQRVVYAGQTGAYAARRVLPAWRAVCLPDAVDMRIAAASCLRGLTAHMLLNRTFSTRPRTVMLVHAAAGGLGATLTRWAKTLECTVIGTVSTEAKAILARENGADHVIIGREADFASEIGRLTSGRGVDFAVDGIGGATLAKTIACVCRFGIVASVGQAAGPIPPVDVEALGPLRSISLARPSVMAYAAERDTYRTAMTAVIAAIEKGIFPQEVITYPLAQAAEAQQALETGMTTGSLVLIP